MATCSVSEITSINGLLLKKKIHDLISQNSKALGGNTTTLQGLNNNNLSDKQKSTLIVEMLKKYYNGYISKDEISQKITLITCEYLLSRFNISIDETTLLDTIKDAFKISEDESNNSESDENERYDEAISGTDITNIDKSYLKLLNFLFSKTPSALNSIPNKFKINIIRRLFVNLDANEGKGFLARTDNISFNKNLADYQNELFDIIVNFLNNNGYSIVSDKLFTGRDFVLNPNYIFIIELAYDYIQSKINSKEHDKLILEGWGNVLRENTLFGDKSSNYNKESADYYKFVEAWINLKYFDDTLKKVFGDVISLRNKEDKNSMPLSISIVDEKKSKYIFGNDRSYRNSGFTDDNKRNGFTEAGRFSIALLTSLPLYSYLKWLLDKDHAKYQQENINLIRVNTSFNKILKLVLQDKIDSISTSDNKGNLPFINAVLNLHGNPKRNITIILNYLFDSDLGILNKIKPYLTEKEIDTLFSLWKNVYNTNPEESSSIVKLENSHLGKQVIAKNGLVYSDCISELIDRVGEVQYVTVYYNNEETPTKIEFRKKFYDDNKKYELRDNINNYINGLLDRESLLNKYIVYEEENSNGDKTGRYIIDLKSFLLIIDPNDIRNTNKSGKITYNIFNSTKNTVYIKINNKIELIDDYFKDVVFTSPETIDLIRDKSTYLNNLLLLFTDTLDYNFLEDNSLQTLHLYKISFPEIFSQLTEGSLRSLISNQILHESKDTNVTEFVLNNSKYSDLFKNSGKIIGGEFVPEDNQNNFYKIGEQYNLNVAPLNLNWITNLASSIEMFAGEEPKSVSSNFAGNKEQNGRTGHLGANLHYYMYKIAHTSNPNEAALNLLPIRNLYRGYTIQSDIKSSKDRIKSIKDLNPQELLFSNIFHNFYGVYLEPSRNSQLNGNVIILPTTYSDKSTIEAFMFYAKEELGQTGKTLMELDDNDLVNFLKETIGAFYTQIGLNIISDYNKIFDTNFTSLSEVNNFLQNLSSEYFDNLGIHASSMEFMLTKLANKKGVEVKRDVHYSIFQGKLGISPLLFENIEIFNNTNKLSNFLKEQRNNFIDSIKNSKLLMSTAEPYVKQAINFVFGSEENGEKQGWIENGYLVVNKGNELNPLLKKYFNAYTAIAPNLRYLLTGSEIGHTLKKTSIYKSKSNGFIKVLKDVGIKAKDLGYSEEEFLSTKENIIKIKERIDNITNNKTKNKALKVYNDVINELRGIAGAEGDLSKRNTIIPATLLYVAQGALNSIPLKIKVAIIEDISAAVNTFNGVSTKEDAHDGSALIIPFFSILENMGLQDLAVNLDKKPIWHHYDPLTGTSTLFKYATFTITNLRMLLSFKSDVSLYNMFKKATNFQWKHSNDDWNSNSWSNSSGSKIDLVNGRKFGFTINEDGEMELKTTIDFRKDIKLGKKLIYGLNNEYWEIFDLNYDKIKGVSTPIYYTTERKLNAAGEYNSKQLKIYHLFDKNSNHIITSDLTDEYLSKIRSGEYHTINSLFELHSTLGGIFCVENHDGEFISSEFNNECIARYMNLVGDARRKHLTDMSGLKNIRIEDVITLEEYNQPLKQLMISMLANPSSTKKGQSNVNPRSSWYNNEELNYCEVDSDGYGIQLDSDHEADEAELTEPTQVMTSLSQGGSLHKYARQIYQSLGRVTLLASKVELSAVKNFIDKQNNDPNNPKNINELYDTIGRIVLNNLSSQSSDMDLSDEILTEIKKEFGINSDDHTLDKLKIAFSDPNIFSHVFPTIISVLNSKGIRRKNPGNGMIMAPAYGIYQLYKLGDQQVTFTELIKHVNLGISEIEGSKLIKRALSIENLESKVREFLETELRTKPIFNYNAFDLGDRVLIHGINKKGIINKDNLFGPNGEINWDYFELILNSYHNNQPDSMFAKDRTTLATRQEKHFKGEKNTLNHIKFVTQSMLDLFEGKYDVDLPFVSEARASLQNQKDLMVLAAMFHDTAKPYRHGDIHGWESADILRDVLGVDYNNRLAEWAIRHHMSMPFSHKAEFSLSNPEAIEVAKNMARDAKRMGIDEQTAINAFVLINASDVINGREITVEDNLAKKAKDKGSTKYGDDISIKAVLTTELKEKVDLLKKAFDEVKDEDFGNPEYNYNYQERFDYKSFPEGGGRLPILHNVGTSIYIDSIDKFYFVQDRNWAALSSNLRLLNKYGITHKQLVENGLDLTIATLRQNLNNNLNELLTLMMDNVLLLYNYSEFQYQEDVTKSVDLRPTRIQFIENGIRHSVYDIPMIKNALKSGIEINPMLMKQLFSDLKKGYYYDNYIEQQEANFIGNGTHLIYIPDNSSKRHSILDIKYERPQTIVSNMLATRFNTNVFKTLQLVKEDVLFDKNKFKQSLEKNKHDIFDIRFLKSNGDNTFISFRKLEKKYNSKNLILNKLSLNNYRREFENENNLNTYKIIQLNSDNSDFIESEKYIEVNNVTYDDGLYMQDGKVLAEQNQYITINDKIFKKFSYLNIYDTTIREKNGKSSKHLTYNIDYEVIKEMCGLLKINEIDFISKLLNKLYISDSYITFDLNIQQTISKDVLKDIGNNSNELRNYVNAIIRNEDSSKLFDNILDIYSNELQTSFLKSLEVIASRIPAQTLLSFMSMDIVGFTQMKYNVAYVSHIQTFLLGSDYDIDKSYMLSYFFDDNGLFIKWSNLMDLSSIDKLNESIKLPIPNKVRIHNESEFSNFTVDNELYKINTSLSSNRKLKEETRLKKELERLKILDQNNKEKVIVDITEELRAIINNPSISNYAELIDKIDRFAIEGFMNNKETSKSLNTFIKYDKSLDNKVVNDILNKVRSHENYVIPEAIKEKALQNANSAKIHLIITDLDNLNAANTPINMDYVRTSASRRQGRTKMMTFWNPAVCLEMQVENQVGKKVIGIAANGEKAFFTLYYYFTECYSKILESGKYDDLKYLLFNKTFNRIQGRWNGNPTSITKTTIANLNPNITKLGDNLKFEVDQMISQLLSAATDNAKELILAKINANSDFAKIFFYGLILGFDLNDLAAFMTSSTVDLIESLAKSNMFDPNIDNLSVDNVLAILDGKYYKILNSFLNEYTLRSINNILYGNKILVDGNEIKSLSDFCNLKAQGKINISLLEFVINTITKYPYYINMGDERVSRFLNLKEKELANLKRLSVYIDNFTSDINKNLNVEDFQEFKELWKMSNELTTFTNVYLNTNQGLPTTMDKYLNKLIGIQNTVRSREKEIPEYIISEDKKISLKSLKGAEANDENIKNLALLFKLVNPQYSEDYLIDVAKKVLDEKLIGTFDYHKWLIDNNYKELVIDYYNCIKGTFNIFHFLKIHPQYNANMQLLAASEVMISNINLKTNLVLDVLKQLIDESVNDFWDTKQNKKLLQSVDDIIIRLVINNFNIELELKDSWKIYDNMWEFLEVTPEKLLFKNGFDYSNFKYVMEKYILPQLKDGKLLVTTKKDGLDVLVSIEDNLFIQNLKETIYQNRPLLALDINMSLRDNSELTNIKFANYSKAFLDLKLYKFPGFTVNGKSMTVLDLFTLYNLIVNKNQYGPNKLTALLKTSVGESNSLLYLYLWYVGEIDQKAFIVSSNEYDNMLKNIEISMAPIISKYLLSFLKKGFYKVKENGITTLYEITDGKPKEYAMYAIDDTGEPTELTIDLKVAVMLYGCLFNVNDAKLANCGKLKSNDPESLQKALENLIKNGKLIIFSNCE